MHLTAFDIEGCFLYEGLTDNDNFMEYIECALHSRRLASEGCRFCQ